MKQVPYVKVVGLSYGVPDYYGATAVRDRHGLAIAHPKEP